MADLVYTMGLDDAEFRARLAQSESAVSRRFGRIGQVIEARTAGVRKFTGAIGSTLGVVTQVTGAFAIMGTVVAGVVAVYQLMNRENKTAIERAERLRETMLEVGAAVRGLSGDIGRDTLGREVAQINQTADEAIAKFEGRLNELRLFGSQGFLNLRVDKRVDARNELAALERSYKAIQEAREKALGDAQSRANRDTATFTEQARIERLRAQGRETEALLAAEKLRFQENQRAIEQRGGEEALVLAAMEAEELRYLARVNQINRLAELERQRKQQQAEDFEQSQKIELARLRGDEAAAKRLERQLEHERKLREIRRLDGITDDERDALEALEHRLYGLRNRSDRDSDAGRTLALGLADRRSIAPRFFGRPGAQRSTTHTAIAEGNRQREKHIALARRSLDTLERIERKTGTGVFT